ncbi:MAG TPA: RidA family protein [Vicinamibacterales bacterium]
MLLFSLISLDALVRAADGIMACVTGVTAWRMDCDDLRRADDRRVGLSCLPRRRCAHAFFSSRYAQEESSMKRTAYQPPDVFVPAGKTYSHGVIVEAGRTLYVAGQTSRDMQGNIVCKGDAEGQARQVLENLKKVIEGAGGRMENVAKTTVFITDLKYRDAVGRVRQEFFKGDPPANTLLVVSGLADPAFLVEIEAIVPLP